MDKETESLSKLDPSEALGDDALLQVMEMIPRRKQQAGINSDKSAKETEKPIMSFRHPKKDCQINPDGSLLKKELREKAKMRNNDRVTGEEGEEGKESWGFELQKELDEKVREFREFNRKKKTRD